MKEYVNEGLWAGHLGFFFVTLSFTMAVLAMLAFIQGRRNPDNPIWMRLGRISFYIHGLGVLGIFFMLFYLIKNQQFQYHYVWAHSSRAMPLEYLVSCFWEGQEGSFLLWELWQFVLGGIILWRAKKEWVPTVMVVLCATQIMLASMVLGLDGIQVLGMHISFGDFKLGSNPFILLRNVYPNIPLFTDSNYIEVIKSGNMDGRGLNALLQNYWMVIHPPVLFLGFALTVMPFCYAIAGLWNRKYTEWIKPALPWVVAGGGILGLGILMGGAWAYEALSFGGFWAWDPVENAVLVPWLTLVAGMHTMLIFKSRKLALKASYLLVIASYVLILYSTFLTRSGVLSDTSVHSFTDLGLSGQLLMFLLTFLGISIIMLIWRWRRLPKNEVEEKIYSREFWMFIGAVILFLSSLHIIALTSIPVYNKIAGGLNSLFGTDYLKTNFASPSEPIKAYHQLQVPLAILLVTITAFTQYLRWIKSPLKDFIKKSLIALGIAIVLTAGFAVLSEVSDIPYLLLIGAGIYSCVVNLHLLLGQWRKGLWKINGAAVGHIGFGLLIVGAVVSNAQREVISVPNEPNKNLTELQAKEQKQNVVLYKGMPLKLGDYNATYLGDSSSDNKIYFKVRYTDAADSSSNSKGFTLHPYVIYDEVEDKFLSASPSTKHYVSKDIFTHITTASNKGDDEFKVRYDQLDTFMVKPGDTLSLRHDSIKLVVQTPSLQESEVEGVKTYLVTLPMLAIDKVLEPHIIKPNIIYEGDYVFLQQTADQDLGLLLQLSNFNKETESFKLKVISGQRPPPQYITLKAMIFPYINILWIGCILMVMGFIIAATHRYKEFRGQKVA